MTGTIIVTGQGSASAVPDLVVVQLAVVQVADGVPEALAGCQAATTRLTSALRDEGLGDADLRTSGMSIHEFWDNQGERRGHVCEHGLQVRVVDFDRLGAVLDRATESAGDALRVRSVSLQLADPEPLRVIAREAAMASARAQASELARLAEGRLGAVQHVVSGSSAEGLVPMARMAYAGADASGVEPGESSETVHLTVTYELLV